MSGEEPHHTLCISFCETASPGCGAGELEDALARTCAEARFPHCDRLYAGSYFCDNYFIALEDGFHESVRSLSRAYELGATLVAPIAGQASADALERRLLEVLDRFGDVYDEVVVNDPALFLLLARESGKRLGLGRLFCREPRDARYAAQLQRTARPVLSAEAADCLAAIIARDGAAARPLVEVDPVAAVADVAGLCGAVPGETPVEVAVHLPFCFATTGRNCTVAASAQQGGDRFRIGCGCSLECLALAQGYRTDEGASYVKHGRTYFFRNPGCCIAGAGSWRIVYAAVAPTMGELL